MEAKYLRLLGMSLLGYGKFFDLLAKCSEDKIDKLLEKAKSHHSKIFSDSKFWKLAHHKTVSVSFVYLLLVCSTNIKIRCFYFLSFFYPRTLAFVLTRIPV